MKSLIILPKGRAYASSIMFGQEVEVYNMQSDKNSNRNNAPKDQSN